MSKINGAKISYITFYTLAIIGILALGIVLSAPINAAAWNGYGYESEGTFNTYNSNSNNVANYGGSGYGTNQNNVVPVIYSISPNSSVSGTGAKVVTIDGANFVPGSVARYDGSDRPTSYLSPNKIAVHLNSSDITRLGEHTITVRNPGGGVSNVAVFTVGSTGRAGATYNDNGDVIRGETLGASVVKAKSKNVISGALTWIFIFILVLIVIVLWRKIFGDKERQKPMKHA